MQLINVMSPSVLDLDFLLFPVLDLDLLSVPLPSAVPLPLSPIQSEHEQTHFNGHHHL